MKHFSASLVGQANQVDDSAIDSRLLIGANDSIEIGAANTATSTGVGLIITTTAADTKYLDGSGQERLLADIPGAAVVTNLHVPISNGTTYVDSVITQSGAGPGASGSEISINLGDNAFENTNVSGNLTVAGNTSITGNLVVTGTTQFNHETIAQYADTYLELNVAQDKTSAQVSGEGGILVEDSFDAGGGNLSYLGLRLNGASTSAHKIQYNAATDAAGTAGTWVDLDFGDVETIQGGAGITVSTTGADQDGLTPSVANPIVSIDLTTTAAGAGGLILTDGAGTGDATLGIAPAGITEQFFNVPGTAGVANDVLTLVDPTAGTLGWVSRSTVGSAGGTGTVRKVTMDIASSGTSTQTYTVDTTTANSQVDMTNIGTNVTVAVYEFVNGSDDAGGLDMLIPENIRVSATSVVVTIPAGGVDGRIVITG